MSKKVIIIIVSIIIIVFLIGGVFKLFSMNDKTILEENDFINHINADTKIKDVIGISKFNEFGRFIFPLDYNDNTDLKVSNIDSLLPYHSHINTNTTLEVVNYMIDEVNNGNKIFYDIYTDKEKQTDDTLNDTGLFFFKGDKNKPFAIICAGGGFSYVGSIHEAYPHALELSKKGYNAFVLQYRVTSSQDAVEDLARAISYIFENKDTFEVDTENYSLWGSSAGARMVAYIGSYGVSYFGGENLPKPSTVVMAYTGHTDYSDDEVPTFVVVGENDGIANPSVMERRVNNLKNMGVDTEFHKYSNLSHGFGLGIGTSAEGWINSAVTFWKKHIN